MAGVVLPWPDAGLSPDARSRTYHKRARLAKKARADAFYATKAANASVNGDGPLLVAITFYPPARYAYDRDGLLSRMKPALDGIADALGVDDVRFRPTMDMGEPVPGGRVVIAVTAL